ncbi:prepilin peptidase-dependent pilin [Affinibrenneria salicis]|uniref:Prepilin peptidase-dependent pilin n=1 Tax=Affinibrenneria salicis TaxID=2590031 RepID=A0A5J5G7F5_9GAMM|nr:prepilin peptidase-dependent pilin [Affinibrenneria salicis]KAA9002585.1 prepilin peptidase-dependent pilin [Affinibrenneria salicis]KAA9003127.1 prepilin peptidase-dependent pilin [Affinibrenneria salicis]
MSKQQGFTLAELMVVIAIIAILSSIGLPAWQGYLRKAALTDMLQAMVPYKTAVDLCALESGDIAGCSAGSQGIPDGKSSRYISKIVVDKGVITLSGQSTLQGLSVALTPKRESDSDGLRWTRRCAVAAGSENLQAACQDVFRFDDSAG